MPDVASGGGSPLLGHGPDDGRIYPRIDLPGMAYAPQGNPFTRIQSGSTHAPGWQQTTTHGQHSVQPVSYPQIAPYPPTLAAHGGAASRTAPGTLAGRTRTRLRWENILPLLTVIALAIAAGMFVVADNPPGSEPQQELITRASTPTAVTEPSMSDAEVEARLNRVDKLISAGSYTEAGVILQALKAAGSAHPQIPRAAARLNRNESRNAQLMADLESHLEAGAWRKVRNTLRALQQLHPLSAEQTALLRQANGKLRAGGSSASGTSQAADASGGSQRTTGRERSAASGAGAQSARHDSHIPAGMGGPPPDASSSRPPAQRPPTSSSPSGAPLQPPPGDAGTPGSVR
jgi:hypothetical protein